MYIESNEKISNSSVSFKNIIFWCFFLLVLAQYVCYSGGDHNLLRPKLGQNASIEEEKRQIGQSVEKKSWTKIFIISG